MGVAYLILQIQIVLMRILTNLGEFVIPSVVSLMESVARVALISLFIILFGINGVPIAIIMTSFVAFIVFYLLLSKKIKFHISLADWVIIASIVGCAFLAAYYGASALVGL